LKKIFHLSPNPPWLRTCLGYTLEYATKVYTKVILGHTPGVTFRKALVYTLRVISRVVYTIGYTEKPAFKMLQVATVSLVLEDYSTTRSVLSSKFSRATYDFLCMCVSNVAHNLPLKATDKNVVKRVVRISFKTCKLRKFGQLINNDHQVITFLIHLLEVNSILLQLEQI